ncbi:hypothetical protein KUV61_17460 [Nocardioides marinus]|nr:hypothetical protein [Nocardioides marinus]
MTTTDPFFALTEDSDWNACIGKQGDEENYADGYIEAAMELAAAVIDKSLYEKRDTLVLPILYNARHAIELTLKLVIREFVNRGVLTEGHKANHDIASHASFLEEKQIPDESFRTQLTRLRPYIDSLTQVDSDGQELRYHTNRDGKQSMDKKALANILVIYKSLDSLSTILGELKNRAYSLCDEWKTGTRTAHCSRQDLLEIARNLPQRSEWGSPDFEEAKNRIRARYVLSNRNFTAALDKIQETRELAGIVGINSTPIHLTNEKAEFLLGKWDTLHPPRNTDALGTDFLARVSFRELQHERQIEQQVINDIVSELSEEELADAETIYRLNSTRTFAEFYEERLEVQMKLYKVRADLRQQVQDLMGKTNFRRNFLGGLRMVGCVALADGLQPSV